MRAVENGVPVVVAANTGPSQIIDGRGRVLAELPEMMQEGTLVAEVPLTGEPTFYTRFGDGFVLAALALVIACAWRGPKPRKGVTG
jgi:apolipoprotein N-acyltransferase